MIQLLPSSTTPRLSLLTRYKAATVDSGLGFFVVVVPLPSRRGRKVSIPEFSLPTLVSLGCGRQGGAGGEAGGA